MNDLAHVTQTNAPPPPAPPQTPAQIAAYLDYALEELKRRRADVIAALENNLAHHPTIEDDETLEVMAENVRIANALSRTGKDRHKQYKEPHLTAGRAVDTWFRTWAEPLERALNPVQLAMNDYGNRKLARQRAAAQAERIRADQEAARLADIAARALERGRPADIALDDAAEAAARADEAADRANARPADLTRVYSAYGAVASVRETWGWEVENFDLIPRHYLMLNEDMVKAAGKKRDASGKPSTVIPGIRWISKTKVGVR